MSLGPCVPSPDGRRTWLAHTNNYGQAGSRFSQAAFFDLSHPPTPSTLDTSTDGLEALQHILAIRMADPDCSPLLRAYVGSTGGTTVDASPLLAPSNVLSPKESHDLLSSAAAHTSRPVPELLKGVKYFVHNQDIWSGGPIPGQGPVKGPDVPSLSEVDYHHTQHETACQLLGLHGAFKRRGWVSSVFIYTAIYIHAHRAYTANPGRGCIDVILWHRDLAHP